MSKRGEFDLIAELFAPLAANEPGALGLSDDAAVLAMPEGCELVATTDAIVAGVHFLPDDPPEDVAAKLMRVNLSDLAAMGARPFAVLSSCLFPRDVNEEWIVRFASGLKADVERFAVPVVGGDTVATEGPAAFSLTALGSVPRGQALRRGGGRAGDHLAVSGTIGDGALGLRAAVGRCPFLADRERNALIERYRRPQPRLSLGEEMRGVATAAIDVSDGLLQDLGHMCRLSGVGARIERGAVPLSEAARACLAFDASLWPDVLSGGDDYELLLAISPAQWENACRLAQNLEIPLTWIGRLVPGLGVKTLDENGVEMPFEKEGYRHF